LHGPHVGVGDDLDYDLRHVRRRARVGVRQRHILALELVVWIHLEPLGSGELAEDACRRSHLLLNGLAKVGAPWVVLHAHPNRACLESIDSYAVGEARVGSADYIDARHSAWLALGGGARCCWWYLLVKSNFALYISARFRAFLKFLAHFLKRAVF